MTDEEPVIHAEVLKERLSKIAGALIVLLESIDEGTEKAAAFEIRQELASEAPRSSTHRAINRCCPSAATC
jgi:hypothetical protein